MTDVYILVRYASGLERAYCLAEYVHLPLAALLGSRVRLVERREALRHLVRVGGAA